MAEQRSKGRFETKFKFGPNIHCEAFRCVDYYVALYDTSKVSFPLIAKHHLKLVFRSKMRIFYRQNKIWVSAPLSIFAIDFSTPHVIIPSIHPHTTTQTNPNAQHSLHEYPPTWTHKDNWNQLCDEMNEATPTTKSPRHMHVLHHAFLMFLLPVDPRHFVFDEVNCPRVSAQES